MVCFRRKIWRRYAQELGEGSEVVVVLLACGNDAMAEATGARDCAKVVPKAVKPIDVC